MKNRNLNAKLLATAKYRLSYLDTGIFQYFIRLSGIQEDNYSSIKQKIKDQKVNKCLFVES